MAIMFPNHVEEFTTTGEERVYNFFKKSLQDKFFTVWYSPDIHFKEPDFVLYSQDSGLIVFEVKDWVISQIIEANPKDFTLHINNRDEKRTNPLLQAKQYVNELMNALAKALPPTHGEKFKLPCPITHGVIFPNITRAEYLEANLAKVIPHEQILFANDINEFSPFVVDKTGNAIREHLKKVFPPKFAFTHNSQELDKIRSILFPVVRIETPKRSGKYLPHEIENEIKALDHCQEQLANEFTTGKRLIHGLSGSGKTLILVHQTMHLLRSNSKVKRILITCFNLSLVGYIRRLLSVKQVPMGSNDVEVISFYDVCERILGEKLTHAKETKDYYQLVIAETLSQIETGNNELEWDAILVDEGQDFSQDMSKIVLGLLSKEHGVLTIVQDDNQSIYQNIQSQNTLLYEHIWESMNIPNLRVFSLTKQYRSTKEISLFASKMLEKEIEVDFLSGPRGNKVNFISAENSCNMVKLLSKAISEKVRQGIPMSEISVLYTKSSIDNQISLPEKIISELEANGLLCIWPAEDERAKRRYDITTDSITISTIYSVKGMDFSCVFLLGLENLEANSKRDLHLAYVGMTRARHELTIVSVDNNRNDTILSLVKD